MDTPPVAAADKSSVPVWATGGRIQLSIEDYVDCVLIARPNGVQAPTDNDTLILPNSISRKRCWNSVMRTARYLETVRECRRKNSVSFVRRNPCQGCLGRHLLFWSLGNLKHVCMD